MICAVPTVARLLFSSTSRPGLKWRREKKELRSELAKSYGALHGGILSDPEALEQLSRVFEGTTAAAKP